MGRFLCELWRVALESRGPIPRLRHDPERGRHLSNLFLGAIMRAPDAQIESQSCIAVTESALQFWSHESSTKVSICSPTNSLPGVSLFGVTKFANHAGGDFQMSAQLLLKASYATSANLRQRPRRPMKPLADLLDPSKQPPPPSENEQPSPPTNVAKPTDQTPPPNLTQESKQSVQEPLSQPARRFGVVSPKDVRSAWVGKTSGPDQNSRRGPQSARGQEGTRSERDAVREPEAGSRYQRVQNRTVDRRPEPTPNRVSFSQLLRSSKGESRKPAPQTARLFEGEEKVSSILEEDHQGIESMPPPVETPRALPSWKVGLANREARAEKAAAKDGEQRLNEAITAATVRLVGIEGKGHEIMSLQEALRRAREAGVDLVEVNARSDPPVCKLVDYRKFKFEAKKKEKERKKQELEQRREKIVKEIRLSSRTDYRDMEMKARIAKEHLALGYQVRCFLQFKKGDRRADIGLQLLPEMLKLLEGHGNVNKPPREAGGRLEMYLRPLSLAERKKLPEYKQDAGPEPEPSKKRRAALEAAGDEEERLEPRGAAESRMGENWEDDEAEETDSDAEEEDSSGEEEYFVGGDVEADTEEALGASGMPPESSVLEVSDVKDSSEEEVDDPAEVLKKDFEELDAAEKSKHEVVPKKKRWAERLRRPLQRKPGRKRKDSDSDSDDEDEDLARRKYGLDSIATDESESDSEDERLRYGRRR